MIRTFEFVSGSPALDLVDTVSGRDRTKTELLVDTDALSAWLMQASLMPADGIPLLAGDVESVRSLREAIFACAAAALDRRPLPSAALALINAAAAAPPLRLQLVGGKVVCRADNGFAAILSTLAEDALRLFVEPTIERLRACRECRMLFIDRSRPGRRRWCSSSSGCGNRAKVRNYRTRKEEARRDE